MRTELTKELDILLANYILTHNECLPTKDFPNVMKLAGAIKEMEVVK